MILTQENYFSVEADKKYFSVSQYKNFKKCSAKAMYDLNNETCETKPAFIEGKLFEALVTGEDMNLFFMEHPEIISQRGPTKGEIKSDFKKVLKAAERFNQQKMFKDIINGCEKQVILTGKIANIDVKCCLDLFNEKEGKIYDIKCMANFDDAWDKKEKCYKPWYYTYDYVLQLAVYQEIVRQNYGIVCDTHLIAASKENEPDLQAKFFDNGLLKLELDEFEYNLPYFNKIKSGLETPVRCETCDYCKRTKIINEFEEVVLWESQY